MKLVEAILLIDKSIKQKPITCPKCGGEDFNDVDFTGGYTTQQIFCSKEKCNADMLIPVKKLGKTIFVKK